MQNQQDSQYIQQLKHLIVEQVNASRDVDLLDFLYKLLLAEG
jgi:hypothetical protein